MTERTYLVDQDTEGIRIAMRELLEEGFQQARMERLGSREPERKSEQEKRTVEQMERIRAARTLAVGYYSFAGHIFRLDAERSAGLDLDPHSLAHFEGAALRTLAIARAEHRARHPPCGACGTEQESRFHPDCTGCGAKFNRKGAKK